MRKRRRPSENESIGLPISAMIDIVFLLIIFFVVTAEIEKDIEDEHIALAAAPHGVPVKKKIPKSITINVRNDGSINIAQQTIRAGELENILKRAVANWGQSVPIIIRADRDVPYKYVKKVITAAKAANIYKIKFNAEIKN